MGRYWTKEKGWNQSNKKQVSTLFHYIFHSIDDCNWWLCSFLSDIKFCKLTDLSFPTYIGFTSDAFCHWPFPIHLFPQIHLYHGLVFPLHLHQVGPPTPLLPPWAEARPVLPHQHIYYPSWTCSSIEKHLFHLYPHSPDLRYNTGHSHGPKICVPLHGICGTPFVSVLPRIIPSIFFSSSIKS